MVGMHIPLYADTIRYKLQLCCFAVMKHVFTMSSCFCLLFSSLSAISTSSGLAAQSTIVQTLKSGDHIVSMGDVYGGIIQYIISTGELLYKDTSELRTPP